MSSCCSNLRFFNTSICNDSCAIVVCLRCPESEVKALEMLVEALIRRRQRKMKANSTRKMIDYSRTRIKERMKGIEAISNPIETLIDILDGTFEVGLLFRSEIGSSSSVRGMILSMLRVK